MRTRASASDQGMVGDNRSIPIPGQGTRRRAGLRPSFDLNFIGATALPGGLTFARGTNATMFNAAGRRVWAPANMVAQSSTAGAVLGIIGSGGAFPTGWARSTGVGISHEIVGITADYIDVRVFGTNSSGVTQYPHFTTNNTPVTVVPNEQYCASLTISLVAGSLSGLPGAFSRLNLQWLASGAYVSEAPAGPIADGVPTRHTIQGPVAATANQAKIAVNCTVLNGQSCDVTLRIGKPQLERKGEDSPKAYIETTGSAYYGPRFDYNPTTLAPRGFLIEGQSTNNIKNSEMVGASVGVHPTNWQAGNTNSVATSVVGVGVEDGMPYVDIRWSGTASAAGSTNIEFNQVSDVAASIGQQWCGSVFVRKLSGTDPTGSKVLQLIEGNPGFLVSSATSLSSTWGVASLRLNRPFRQYQLINAATTVIRMSIAMTYALSEVVDITLRIGCPQLEGGTTPSCYAPSSPIPTFGVVATRSLDSCTSAFTLWNVTEGTIFGDFETPMANAAAFVPAVAFSDGTAANRTHMSSVMTPTTIGGIMHSVVAGVTEVNLNATPVAGARCKSAYRYRLNDWAISSNGGAPWPDTTAGVLPSVTAMALGVSSTVNTPTMWRWIRQISYYNTGLTDAQLQAITA